jgi:hypothetical protein
VIPYFGREIITPKHLVVSSRQLLKITARNGILPSNDTVYIYISEPFGWIADAICGNSPSTQLSKIQSLGQIQHLFA